MCCLDVISEMALCFSSFFLWGGPYFSLSRFLFLDFYFLFWFVSTTESLVLYASNYEKYINNKRLLHRKNEEKV